MDADAIEIFCDDPAHEGRRWIIEVLTRDEHGWFPAEWGGSGRKGAKSSLQFIKTTEQADTPDRKRYKFPCHLCGRTVTVRFESMTAVCDKLNANGHKSINLVVLAAIL